MKLLATILGMAVGAWALVGEEPPAEPAQPQAEQARAATPDDDPVSACRAGVIGGPHDFSDLLGGPADACKACHVPHVQVLKPEYPEGEDDAGVKLEPSVSIYRIPGQRGVFQPDQYMPGPSSLLCLGCHDGTMATSTIGSSHALMAGRRAGYHIPDDFAWRDHPIGVPYPERSGEYRSMASVEAAGVPLPEGRIECISCHDPHNRSGLQDMLVISNARSALCLTCHVK